MHCEQAYPVGDVEVTPVAGQQYDVRCAVNGCNGSPLDWHAWAADDWPRSVNPGYPAEPETDREYLLYSD
jgi:hypothetical protein